MTRDASGNARDAVALAARESYGRVVAFLAVRWRDVAAAEDAAADALAAALEQWPNEGVPAAPEAWLFAVARRRLGDAARRARVRERPDVIAALTSESETSLRDGDTFPDERLRLMLVCAHPAIDPAVRPALILQVVLGVDAKAMASAFLLSTEAMTKRLVRAKAKIRTARIPFEEPAPEEMRERLGALLEALYAAYFIGREGTIAPGDAKDELGAEARALARIVAAALPDSAEALGFFALVQFCEARRRAQTDQHGAFVPLLEQDPATWDHAMLANAYETLARASRARTPGPFQIEAAIQAAHCYRARSGEVPWRDIATLYETLVTHHPTTGARVSRAVAVAYADGDPARGIALLEALDPDVVRSYQPWWVALGHLHELAGRRDEAKRCVARALGLTSHPRLQAFLGARLAALGAP